MKRAVVLLSGGIDSTTTLGVAIAGQATRALGPEDMLLHTVIHGMRFNQEPVVRWIPDALAILVSAGDALDWDLVVREAERRRLRLRLGIGLAYLRRQRLASAQVALQSGANVTRAAEMSGFGSDTQLRRAWHQFGLPGSPSASTMRTG